MASERKRFGKEERRRLWNKQEGKCILCGKAIDLYLRANQPGSPEIDHVRPLAADGGNHRENLALLHRSCNALKSDMPLSLARRELERLEKYPPIWR